MIKKHYLLLILSIVLFSCDKDDDETKCTTEPATSVCEEGSYCFERNDATTVSFGGQTTRLNQLSEITTYMKTVNNGDAVSATQLKEMFSNNNGTGSAFFSEDANTASKQLKNKTFLAFHDQYETYMDEMEVASQSTTAGSNGTAGVVISTSNPDKKYLFNASGFEYTQLIEKGLMGDCFYYQAMDSYLAGVENSTYGNEILEDKNYTENEHKFDEAYGYFGIPIDFLTNSSDNRFHGKYCNSRDGILGTNESIFNSFVATRNAITAQDQDAIVAETPNIRLEWHRTIAGTIVHYLNAAITNMDDSALKCHELSEAYAFIGNLVHNAEAYNITIEERDACRALLGTNFYETSVDDINAAKAWMVANTAISLLESADL